MFSLGRLFSSVIVTLAAFTFCATAAEVVDVEGGNAAKVGTDDVVRVIGKGIAGAQITVKVDGAGKLEATNDVRKIKNGQTVIGVSIKEFMIKPTMKGQIDITVTVKNPTSNEPIETKYKVIAE